MGQRGTLRQPGGAGGELDVDRLVELQNAGQFRQARPLRGAAHVVHAVERDRARRGIAADLDDDAQRRQLRRVQMAWTRVPQFRRQRVDHADIVAGLERCRGDQRAAADLVQRVFQLRQPVGRVDVHQDQPGLRGGELRDHPFGIVRRPDADALARLQPQRDQSGGERIDLLAELAPAPADALLARDQPRPVAPARNGPVEMTADRFADQGDAAGAMRVAWRGLGHRRAPMRSCHGDIVPFRAHMARAVWRR